MTKTEFLEHLEKRLHVLNKKERDDILSEYAQHIELKMENGLDEEAAIQDFGDLNELEAEILDAYNVNPDYDKKSFHIDKSKIKTRVTRVGKRAESLWKKGTFRLKGISKDKPVNWIKMILKISLILGVLFLLYLPCAKVVFWIGDGFYSLLSWPFDDLLSGGIIVVFHIIYLIFALFVLYAFTVGRRESGAADAGLEGMETEICVEEQKKKYVFSNPFRDVFSKFRFAGTKRLGGTNRNGHLLFSFWNIIRLCAAIILKGAAICFLTPVFLFLLMLVVAFGTMLVLLFQGYPVVGMTIMTLGGLLSGFSFIWFVCDLLFVKKVREEK